MPIDFACLIALFSYAMSSGLFPILIIARFGLDNMISRGEVKMIVPYRLPAIAGNELAGIVEKIGAASQNFKREIGCSPDCLWITLEHLQSM